MDFGEVLGTSWKIVWKHKVLWLFGAIVVLTGFPSLVFKFLLNPISVSSVFPDLAEAVGQSWWRPLILVLQILTSAVTFPIGVWAMTATSLGVLRAERGAERLSFGGISKDSLPFFWRALGVMGMYLAVAILGAGVLIVVITLLSVITLGVAFLCMLPLMLVLIPVVYLMQAYLDMTIASFVADNLRVFAGIERTWTLFKRHFGPILLTILIVYLGIGILAVLVSLPFTLSSSFLPTLVLASRSLDTPAALVIGIGALVYFPIFVILSSLLTTFIRAAWVITYLRLSVAKPAWQMGSLENA